MRQPYRLGIDIGTNSLGWCVLDIDESGRPCGVRNLGVRIFPDGRDPQSQASLAETRRVARGQRRRRDRYLDRRRDLMKALVESGLMPAGQAERKKLEDYDPYRLRAEGLDRQLTRHELGRALFHLNQRRGFKSNRKTERGRDPKEAKETDGMKGAIGSLSTKLGSIEFRTLGEFLWKRACADRAQTRTKEDNRPFAALRAQPTAKGARNTYDLYFSRAMYESEFEALWEAQAARDPSLTPELKRKLKDIIFHQRDLHPVKPGRCTLIPEEFRAPLAYPIVQQFRILQELANLELIDVRTLKGRRLTMPERDALFGALCRQSEMKFTSMRNKVLKVGSGYRFNLEDERRDKLKGDSVSAQLCRNECFGEAWFSKDEAEQTEIVQFLLDQEDEERAIEELQRRWALDESTAQAVASIKLPDRFGSLSLRVLREIVPIMRVEASGDGGPIYYAEAVARIGRHHSNFQDGEILDELPYYGAVLRRYTAEVKSKTAPKDEEEHGRAANPTVHVAMNQVRGFINDLIRTHGHPDRIIVKVARDLQAGAEERSDIRKRQSENKKKNDERRKRLEELGQRVTPLNLLRLRLWEELGPPHDRRCVYTNRPISCAALFSNEFEIEHILPFSQSLDDSPANLTVSYWQANRDKGNETPFRAFQNRPGYAWDDILLRASNLPPNKQWRFREDALELVKSRTRRAFLRSRAELPPEVLDDIERSGGFLARQLVDTAYAARLIRQYLWKVCNPNKVSVTPGRLTALLRSKWGLGLNALLGRNEPEPGDGQDSVKPTPVKMRSDHRHHSVDAFVVAMTDFATLHAVSNAADQERNRLIRNMPPPWPEFRLDELAGPLRRMVVSHKPEHGTGGRFLQQTAYGPSPVEGSNIVVRKPIEKLSAREVNHICDERLRNELKSYLGPLAFDEDAIKEAKDRYKEARERKDKAVAADAKAEIERLEAEKKAFKKSRKESKSSGKDLQNALSEFGRAKGIRRVRVLDLMDEAALRWDRDVEGRPYKAYQTADNHHVDVFERADGSLGAEVVALVDSNRRGGYAPKWKKGDGVRRYGRFHKGDVVRMEVNGMERIFRVVSIWEKYLQLAEHFETNLAERYREKEFKWTFANYNDLRARKLRKIGVDRLGRVQDPGPPK